MVTTLVLACLLIGCHGFPLYVLHTYRRSASPVSAVLGYVVKAHLHTHRGAQSDKPRPARLLPAPSGGHHPIKSPSAQAQWSTWACWQVGTQIKVFHGMSVWSRSSRTVPVEASAPRSCHETYRDVSLGASPSGLRGVAVKGGDTAYGVQGKSILGWHGIYGGMSREDPKVGKRRDLGDLGRKIEGQGDRKGWLCVNRQLVHTLLRSPPAPAQHSLSCCPIKFPFLKFQTTGWRVRVSVVPAAGTSVQAEIRPDELSNKRGGPGAWG